jgi:hypothetical protein
LRAITGEDKREPGAHDSGPGNDFGARLVSVKTVESIDKPVAIAALDRQAVALMVAPAGCGAQ